MKQARDTRGQEEAFIEKPAVEMERAEKRKRERNKKESVEECLWVGE